MSQLGGWFRDNQVLAMALAGQAIIAGIYMVNLEAKVSTLEDRGSKHLEAINTRLTVTEKETEGNKSSLDRIKDIMTRDLHIAPSQFGGK